MSSRPAEEKVITRLPFNPFATRYIRAGRIEPLNENGVPCNIEEIFERFQSLSRYAAIEGPHGSGKSTLLAAIVEHCKQEKIFTKAFVIRSFGDVLQLIYGTAFASRKAIVCVDGWERVGYFSGVVMAIARFRRCGLLVTSHKATRLSQLMQCRSNQQILNAVVGCLPSHGGIIQEDDCEDAFRKSSGNLREALLDLYDRFERRIRTAKADA